jgi:CBS domain-containing protein
MIIAKPRTPVLEAMRLMIQNRISCLPVVDDSGELAGIISDKDIFAAVYESQEGFAENTVGELMTQEVIVSVLEDDLNYIANIMTTNRVRHIPVVDQSRLVGLVSIGDVVKEQMTQVQFENRYLMQYITGEYPG